jgi:hypothetical protein
MDAELIRNLANADERMVSVSRRHRQPRTFARSSITRIHQGTSDRLERPDAGRASLRTTRRRATACRPVQSAQRRRAKRAQIHSRSPSRRAARQARKRAPAAGRSR